MKSVLHFNIKENALLSAMPYTAMLLMSLLLSPFADWLNNKRILKVEFSRKLFNTIGLWGPMTALICLAYVTDKVIAVALVTIAVGINASTYLGFQYVLSLVVLAKCSIAIYPIFFAELTISTWHRVIVES